MAHQEWRLRPGFVTHPGRERERNEDAYAVYLPYPGEPAAGPYDAVLLVADGMGGHEAGDAASRFVADAVIHALTTGATAPFDEDAAAAGMRTLLRRIDRDLRAYIKQLGVVTAGSTVTLGALRGSTLFIGHVGDSRLYRLRGDLLEQLTPDHSWVADQVRSGLLDAAEAMTHPKRNLLTQCLGIGQAPKVSTGREPVIAGDRFLLCSDGLHAVVPDAVITRVLVDERDAQAAAARLVDLANEAGGPDNITALVLDLEPPVAQTLTGPVVTVTPESELQPAELAIPSKHSFRRRLAGALTVCGLLLTVGAAALASWHYLEPGSSTSAEATIPAGPVLRDTMVRAEEPGTRADSMPDSAAAFDSSTVDRPESSPDRGASR